MVKLRAAMALAHASWQNALANQANDAPAAEEADFEGVMLKDAYLAAVLQYNQAIAQIPAAWIAALFGFKSEYLDESKH
jgi:hypothetical protein